jgi:hypothetical protein
MCSPHAEPTVAARPRRSEAKPNSLLTLPWTVGGAEPSATSTSQRRRGVAWGSSCPSEFSKLLLETLALPRASRPPGGLAARSECVDSMVYRACWVSRSRFAVSPRPGCAVFHRRIVPTAVKRTAVRLSSGFGLPMEFCPATSSPPAAADRRLSWTFVPFSTYRNRRSLFLPGVSRTPCTSAFRVWLPS